MLFGSKGEQEWERDSTLHPSFALPAHVLVAMGSTRAECKKLLINYRGTAVMCRIRCPRRREVSRTETRPDLSRDRQAMIKATWQINNAATSGFLFGFCIINSFPFNCISFPLPNIMKSLFGLGFGCRSIRFSCLASNNVIYSFCNRFSSRRLTFATIHVKSTFFLQLYT